MITSRLMGWLPFFLPLYLVRFAIGPLPTTLLEVYVLSIVAVFLYEFRFRGLQTSWQTLEGFQVPIIVWMLVTLLAVGVSPSLRTGLGLWRAYILEPVFLFLILKGLSIKTDVAESLRTRISTNMFLVTCIVAIWALVQYVTGLGIPHPWNVAITAGRRATGPFPYPNALALFVVPIAAYSLSLWPIFKTKVDVLVSRALIHPALPVMAYVAAWLSVILARSEGGGIALGVVTWLALMTKKAFRPWVIAGTILCVALIVLVPKIHNPIMRELTFQGWSGKVRMYMWRDTAVMLKDHWFLGAGFGGYPQVFKAYQRTRGIEIFQYPHNILLNFWSETGMLGVLSFVWILSVWLRSCLRGKASQIVLCTLPIVAILIHGLVDVPFFKNDLAIIFWLLTWLTTYQYLNSGSVKA